MENNFKQILIAASAAPSGENVQPWNFSLDGNILKQYNVSERDKSYYNYKSRGQLVSHGCAIENILIKASTFGYDVDMKYFPNGEDSDLIAIFEFNKKNVLKDDLSPYILDRVTNRKPYKDLPLTLEQKQSILDSIKPFKGITLLLEEDSKAIQDLAYVGSANEKIMLENPALHNFFFSHLTWTKKEDERVRNGFYIKTLELPPPVVGIFKLIKYRPVVRLLNSIGFSDLVYKQNADIYKQTSAIGIFSASDDSKLSFLEAGRALERMWLTITKLGLSLQPMTGVLFFNYLLSQGGNNGIFTNEQETLIKEKYEVVESVFKIHSGIIPIMFRIGNSEPPSTRASRFGLDDILK